MLTDEEVWDCYQHSHGNTEYTKAKAFGRMLQIRIEAKLRGQKPVALLPMGVDIAPSIRTTCGVVCLTEKEATEYVPESIAKLYAYPVSGTAIANFIYKFKRHVGGDGEFWLHELEDFYTNMAARSGE